MDAFVVRTPKVATDDLKSHSNKSTSYSTDSKSSKLNINKSSTIVSISSSVPKQQPNSISSSDIGALNKIKPSKGQRRISDLGGVVVIEKIKEYVRKLSDPNIAIVAKVIDYLLFMVGLG